MISNELPPLKRLCPPLLAMWLLMLMAYSSPEVQASISGNFEYLKTVGSSQSVSVVEAKKVDPRSLLSNTVSSSVLVTPAKVTSTTGCYIFKKDIGFGTNLSKKEVAGLNGVFAGAGISYTLAGNKFSEETALAVVKYQSLKGLAMSGVIGQATRTAMAECDTAPENSSINVLSPEKDTNIEVLDGRFMKVKWLQSTNIKNILLSIIGVDAGGSTYYEITVAGNKGTNEYDLDLGLLKGIDSGQYKIKVCDKSTVTAVSDINSKKASLCGKSESFNIVNKTKYLIQVIDQDEFIVETGTDHTINYLYNLPEITGTLTLKLIEFENKKVILEKVFDISGGDGNGGIPLSSLDFAYLSSGKYSISLCYTNSSNAICDESKSLINRNYYCNAGSTCEPVEISSCVKIDKRGSYKISKNLESDGTCITIAADYVLVRGSISPSLREIKLSGNGTGFGIIAENVKGITIQNIDVENFSTGVQFNNVSKSSIDYIISSSNTKNGFNLYNSAGNAIYENIAIDSMLVGFDIDQSSNGNKIMGNTAYGSMTYGGIRFSSSGNNLIKDNKTYGNKTYGISLEYSMGNEIINNQTYSNQDGISLLSSSENKFSINNSYSNSIFDLNCKDTNSNNNIFNFGNSIGTNNCNI